MNEIDDAYRRSVESTADSRSAATFRGSKIWVEIDAGRSIQFGKVFFPDCDTWVRVDGVLVEVREGQRVEITRDAVTIKELVR